MQSSTFRGKVDSLVILKRAGEVGNMADLLRDCSERDQTVFLFGGDSRAIYALRERAGSTLPVLRIAGVCDADFAGPISRAVLDHVAAAVADIIVTDLPEARFRLFGAQCVAMGIYGKRINLPGSFADFAFGPGQGLLGLSVPTRLRRFGVAARAGLQFVRIILRQRLDRAASPAEAARACVLLPRRGGRG